MSRFLEEIQELPEALIRMVSFYKTDGRERLQAWAERTKEHRSPAMLCFSHGRWKASLFAPL